VWVDHGLLDATRNLLASPQSASPVPGYNAVKQLSAILPGSRARLASLRLEADFPPTTDERGKSSIAYCFWSQVWAARPAAPEGSADNFLQSYTKRVDTANISAPDLEAVLNSILLSNNSTPGPEGIPFAAWRAVPNASALVLHGVLNALVNGLTPTAGFNHGFLFLLPKKDTGLVSDTRPISHQHR